MQRVEGDIGFDIRQLRSQIVAAIDLALAQEAIGRAHAEEIGARFAVPSAFSGVNGVEVFAGERDGLRACRNS